MADIELGFEGDAGRRVYLYQGSYAKTVVIFLVVALVGMVLFHLYGGKHPQVWNLNIREPTGVTTNPAKVSFGSGYPAGTWVGNAAGFGPGGEYY